MSLNDILFAMVCLAAVYARSVSAALFCAAYAMHSFYSAEMEQWLRYVALILIDSATAFLLCAMGHMSAYIREANRTADRSFAQRLVVRFSLLLTLAESFKSPSRASVITGVSSGVFLAVNVAGFAAWFFYLPPAPYDAICSVIYIAMMAALINEGSNGCRVALYDLGLSAAHSALRKGLGMHKKNGDKV